MSTLFSIRNKIIICFLILVTLMSCVFGLISYLRIINAMHSEVRKNGIGEVKILSQMAAPYVFDSDYATMMDVAEKLIEEGEIVNFAIVDRQGSPWMTTHPLPASGAEMDPFYVAVIENKTENYRRVGYERGNVMEFAYPITALGKVKYILKIEKSLKNIENQAMKRIRESLFIGLVMVCVAALIAIYLARILNRPIQTLVQGTRELSRGNLKHRIAVRSSDETGLLSQSFNLMAQNLETELSVRKEAESKLQEYSEQLENIVNERTGLLTDTNARLSEEIEERKKTEIALLESRERYRRFSEVTLDGIVFHNEDGVVDISRSFSKMFGYSLESIKGKGLIEAICLSHQKGVLQGRLDADSEQFIETVGRKESGETFPIEMQSKNMSLNGKNLTVTSIRDTTERKQLKAQLHQAQRMEGIGRLASGIAHDLNNILSGIVTLPQFLLLDMVDDNPLKEPLLCIQHSGESAAVVVQDMLTLARSSFPVEKVIDPAVMLKTFINSPESQKLRQTHPGITIKLSVDELVGNIKGSPVHIAKALLNLVQNGADAIEGEGTIVIGLRSVIVDEQLGNYETIHPGNYVCFSVKDSGTGIVPENIPYVFEPFYTKKVLGRSGTGLGMVIVWNTVKDHKGYIDIKSDGKIGTEVSIYFPVTEDEVQQPSEDPDIQSLAGDSQAVLVVDDIEEQRKIASTILERLNYQVRTVAGGVEAVEFLQKQPVDVVLLDMIMDPGINGLETSKRIFAVNPDAVIIIASGYAESEMVKEALELGAKQYLKKPYSIEALGQALRDCLK